MHIKDIEKVLDNNEITYSRNLYIGIYNLIFLDNNYIKNVVVCPTSVNSVILIIKFNDPDDYNIYVKNGYSYSNNTDSISKNIYDIDEFLREIKKLKSYRMVNIKKAKWLSYMENIFYSIV